MITAYDIQRLTGMKIEGEKENLHYPLSGINVNKKSGYEFFSQDSNLADIVNSILDEKPKKMYLDYSMGTWSMKVNVTLEVVY